MTKHYTELTGATGERIQFGTPRYEASNFFHSAPPVARIGLKTYPLHSVSVLGFSLMSDDPVPGPAEGEALEVRFEQRGSLLAVRSLLTPGTVTNGVVECRFLDQAVDLEQLRQDNAAAVAASRMSVPRIRQVEVPSDYKIFCADVLDTMSTLRRQIEDQIGPFEAGLTPDEREVLDQELEAGIADQWLEFLERANNLVLPYKYDEDTRMKMKRYTENVVTREMVRGALQHRCYYKPLGYPGDFEIMNAFYHGKPRGETSYDRLVDMLGLIAGRPVTARMHWITRELEDMVKARQGQDHLHVMSIGSGPAREWQRYFSRNLVKDQGFTISLVDPEPMALEFAIKGIYSSIKTGLSSVMVSGLNTSFTEMLRPRSTFRHLPPQDFIYSTGLTDYLNTNLTRSLIAKLYEHLKPGGSVVIGNINDDPNGMYWSAEYAVDWSLYFRNRREMEEICDGLPGDPELTKDDSGSWYMLKLTKPF